MPVPGGAVVVGVDVGGTKVLAAVVEGGRVLRTARRATPGRRVEPRHVEDAVVAAVEEVADGRPVAAVGIAAAGLVAADRRRVVFAPHLPWRGQDVVALLGERLGAPVVLDNDADAAAYAEARFGAARGADPALVVNLGTGIGGALLVGGRPLRGLNGMAGEFGHVRVVPDGRPCECGSAGCWEQYASGGALVREARERLVGGGPTVLDELCGGVPAQLTGPMVTAAAEEGDLVALAAFEAVGRWLGAGLADLVAALDPVVVVVGGGVSAAGERLLEPARRELARLVVGGPHRTLPPVVAAALGPEAGAIGAAALAAEALATGP